MPTENRSSNTENAPCPFCGGQVDREGWLRGDGMRGPECDSCGATAPNLALWNGAQPAQHHQGEPVALPARKSQPTELSDVFVDANNEGWNACLDEIAKLGPLYTHPAPADAGEVEQLRERVDLLEKYETDCLSLVRDAESERDTLRAQLAERDALLRDALSELENGPLTFNRAELRNRLHVVLSASAEPSAPAPFQARVQPWLLECFGEMIAGDREERNHRFLEEALELVQALGATSGEAHQLVDYVFGRAVGEPAQEVGGVMVTLAALCLANGLDMHQLAETELARIWTKVEQIRAKQANKPQFGPLPGVYPDRKP